MRNTKIVLFELMLCLLVIYGIFILNKKANEKNEMQNTQNKIIAELIDAILLELIMNDKGIEINTSGLRYGLPYPHPNIEIIKRYKELGGKIITIGSDAHNSDDLAKDFDLVYDILRSLNIKEIAVFHNRIPDFICIK